MDYALGLTTEEQNVAIEATLAENEKWRAELDAIVACLGSYASDCCPGVPPDVKGRIKQQLGFSNEAKTKLVALEKGKPKSSTWRWYAVAASVGLVLSLAYNVMLNNELQKAELTIAGLRENATELARQDEVLRTNYAQAQHTLSLVRHEKTHMVRMLGTDFMPDGMATVIWNPLTKEVMVDVNHLPAPPENHQHQLWALVGGQPVDLGVFEVTGVAEMQLMKPIDRADAFAVTLEVAGGSPTPNLERLCVLGEI